MVYAREVCDVTGPTNVSISLQITAFHKDFQSIQANMTAFHAIYLGFRPISQEYQHIPLELPGFEQKRA